MNLCESAGARILQLSALVAEIAVREAADGLEACIVPNLDEAARQGVVNLSDEIRWYAVELYNLEAPGDARIVRFRVRTEPLPKRPSGGVDTARLDAWMRGNEADIPCRSRVAAPLYDTLKRFVETLTERPVCPESHFEFDLGLDSLDYVALFAFAESSFGVTLSEGEFASMMTMEALWRHIEEAHSRHDYRPVGWPELFRSEVSAPLPRSPRILTLYRWLALPLFHCYFRLCVEGMERIPEGPCIIAPTHQSMLDGFIMTAALPAPVLRRTYTLAFEKVFGRGVMTPVARFGQLLLIDVNSGLRHAVAMSAQPLKQGDNLLIFPEGARSRDRELLEFRPLFTMLSKTFDVPVVPVVLDGTFEALGAGMLFPRPAKVAVRCLEPVYPDAGESAEAMSARIKKRVKEEMEAHPLHGE